MDKTDNGNIILIGFSTTGKSKVARQVARRLGWEFVDTDDEIVKLAGKPIPEIFAQDGEERFREMEREVLEKTCAGKERVIATGGGAILNAGNRELLKRSGMVVCLEAKPETIYSRLLQDTEYAPNPVVRPLLVGPNPLKRIESLKAFRQPYYAIADWTVHSDALTLEEVSEEVVRAWQHWRSPLVAACQVRTATESYPVFVGWGWLDRLGEQMRRAGLSGVANIISDEDVFPLYGARATQALRKAGFEVGSFVVPSGERTKTIETATSIYDFLVERHVERDDALVALGGGMVGDLAGFVAATFLRGLPFVQVPTSLVAMVDASIGGKVAVNHPRGKNLIGAFYQPRLVLADVQALTTLPRRELVSGWAEVAKHGLILAPELFRYLEDNAEHLAEHLMGLEPETTTRAVAWSARIKAGVVSEDEKERGKRIVLNYGHTIAHGLEAATDYQQFLHGEAVAIGIMGAVMLSQRRGLASGEIVERQRSLLQRFGLPTSCSGVGLEAVLRAMELDKKVRGRAVRWVLLGGLGQVVIDRDVSQDEVVGVLRELGLA